MTDYRGPGGWRGPDYGYYGPGDVNNGSSATTSASAASSSPGGSSSLPVWALVLIMVGSGLLTLTVLGLFVLVLCRRRRARRAAMREDLEAQAASERETVRMLRTQAEAKEVEEHAKRCAADAGVELTFVVMAGEDQPSYLARPAPPITSTPLPPTKFEKHEHGHGHAHLQPVASCLPLSTGLAIGASNQPIMYDETHEKSPPSPSRELS